MMNYYKPYSYLYKKTTSPSKLKSCFICKLPAGKKLSGPTITNEGNITTISYSIVSDQKIPADWDFEDENLIAWNGTTWIVVIEIGSGSGSTGGTDTQDSTTAETM